MKAEIATDRNLARTFLEIVTNGNFLRAAELLHVTQTAVSAPLGGAAGAGAGAVRGNVGERAATGAAAGAAAGAAHGAIHSGEPGSVYKGFVQRCLREKGYDVIGWK